MDRIILIGLDGSSSRYLLTDSIIQLRRRPASVHKDIRIIIELSFLSLSLPVLVDHVIYRQNNNSNTISINLIVI